MHISSVGLTLLLSGLVATANAIGSGSRYDPLATWLANLTVSIPDQHFKKSVLSLDIRGLACSQFEVETINSTYVPSSSANSENPSLGLAIAGISATCHGVYHTTGLTGQVTATVASSSSERPLQLNLIFCSNTSTARTTGIRMATNVTTKHCDSNLDVADLKFTGSISAHIINLFQSEIRGYVSKTLSTELCPVLESTIDRQLSNALQAADRYMMGLIQNEGATERPVFQTKKRASRAWSWSHHAPLVPTTLRLLNTLVLEPFLHEGVVLKILQTLLGQDFADDCGYFFRGWNGLLNQVTNGTIEFPVPNLQFLRNISIAIPNYASISVIPKHLRLSGFDQLDRLQILSPKNNSSLFQTDLVVSRGFNLLMEVDITVSETPGGSFQGDDLMESFEVSILTSSLDFSSTVSLDLNGTSMQTTTMKHILSAFKGDNPVALGCSLNPIKAFGIESLNASVGIQSISFLPKIVNASLEEDIDAMINNFLQLFLTEYDELSTLAFAALLQGPAKHLAETATNNWIKNLIQTSLPDGTDSVCEVSGRVNSSNAEFLNISSQARFLFTFNDFLNHSVDKMNAYSDCVADVVTTQITQLSPSVDYGGATLRLQNVSIDHAGSLQSIELLSPGADGHHVSNTFQFGQCMRNDTSGQNLSCNGPHILATAQMLVPSSNISGIASFTASFGSFRNSISGLFLYDLNQLKNLTLLEILSCQFCFAKPATEAVLEAVDQLVECISIGIEAELKGYSSEPIHLQLDSVSHDGATSALRSLFSWFELSVVEVFNQAISHVTQAAHANCGVEQEDEKRKGLTAILSVIVFLLPFYILSHIVYLAFGHGNGPLNTDEQTLAESDDANVDSKSGTLDLLWEKNTSLMTNAAIPNITRHVFPIILVVTTALLAASNLSVGASVDATISVINVANVIQLPSIFAFSLGNTIYQMYKAGIFVLLFMVVIFSGIWPYLKLVMMFCAWILPEAVLSLNKRDKLLFSLDALSKFSLVDTFVLVIMMVSFRLHLEVGSNAVFDIFVNPHFGFYGFLFATTISLVAGHIEMRFHRRCASTECDYPDNRSLSLFSYSYTCDGRKYALSKLFKLLLVICMTATFVLLTIGSLRKSFTFEFGGLTGALLGDHKMKSLSLVSIGTSIPEAIEHSNGPGVMFLQMVYYFYACIMPCACLVTLLVIMIVPMNYSQQEKWLTTAEVTNAWSAIEVFVISIIAALFEISTFASFIVGHKCDILNQILRDEFHDEFDGDSVCFSLTASASSDVWCLVVGVVLNSALVSTLLRMAHAMVEERAKLRDGSTYVAQVVATCSWSRFLFVVVEEDSVMSDPLLREYSDVNPLLDDCEL